MSIPDAANVPRVAVAERYNHSDPFQSLLPADPQSNTTLATDVIVDAPINATNDADDGYASYVWYGSNAPVWCGLGPHASWSYDGSDYGSYDGNVRWSKWFPRIPWDADASDGIRAVEAPTLA